MIHPSSSNLFTPSRLSIRLLKRTQDRTGRFLFTSSGLLFLVVETRPHSRTFHSHSFPFSLALLSLHFHFRLCEGQHDSECRPANGLGIAISSTIHRTPIVANAFLAAATAVAAAGRDRIHRLDEEPASVFAVASASALPVHFASSVSTPGTCGRSNSLIVM